MNNGTYLDGETPNPTAPPAAHAPQDGSMAPAAEDMLCEVVEMVFSDTGSEIGVVRVYWDTDSGGQRYVASVEVSSMKRYATNADVSKGNNDG